MKKTALFILVSCFLLVTAFAQKASVADCFAELTNDELTIKNSQVKRVFKWNNGHLQTKFITDLISDKTWNFVGKGPDLFFPNQKPEGNATIFFREIEQSDIENERLEIEVITLFEQIQVKRVLKIYPNCPAIACDIFLRGKPLHEWTFFDKKHRITTPFFERLTPSGIHWKTTSVEFSDRTDDNNNLVRETVQLVFTRQSRLKGNLIFAEPQLGKNGLFILKESPNGESQLGYPGTDFITFQSEEHYLEIQVAGLNISPWELNDNQWIRCSGFVTGVSENDELSKLTALKTYQEKIRVIKPERDEMMMLNTWGDRGQDAKINEQFCIDEIKAAKKLGLTHFQLDDGWQNGITANSAQKGGSLDNIWQKQNYWNVNSERFPNGLQPVVDEAKKQGIKLGLWFNPSHDNSYANWKKDAEVIIGFYQKFGICVFKIDGVDIPDKKAEINFRSFLDTIRTASNGEIAINLDVTGLHKRPGYFCHNGFGNIFLENRYTDWVNYYPHWTLRNLWILSGYIPAQNFQIEFLNKWRNASLYKTDDVFAPANIPFGFQFALTTMAQPLAWFEGSNLPAEAYEISDEIHDYQKVMAEIHTGKIFPIGEEPDGTNWSGFQSVVTENSGFLLILRMHNENENETLFTWLPEGKTCRFEKVIGKGENFVSEIQSSGEISFSLPEKWNYVLYKYQIHE